MSSRRGSRAAPPTAEQIAVVRAAVCEICSQVPADQPLAVSPAEAPNGTLDEPLLKLVRELREAVADDKSPEALAHLDDFTLARFVIAH